MSHFVRAESADLLLAGDGAGGGVGASERANVGIGLIQRKENNPMEGTGMCVTGTLLRITCANRPDSCLENINVLALPSQFGPYSLG